MNKSYYNTIPWGLSFVDSKGKIIGIIALILSLLIILMSFYLSGIYQVKKIETFFHLYNTDTHIALEGITWHLSYHEFRDHYQKYLESHDEALIPQIEHDFKKLYLNLETYDTLKLSKEENIALSKLIAILDKKYNTFKRAQTNLPIDDVNSHDSASQSISLIITKAYQRAQIQKERTENELHQTARFFILEGFIIPILLLISAVIFLFIKTLLTTNKKLYSAFTQLQTVENALKRAKEKAECASKSKSEFLANMSHEIRTPLNAIINFTYLILQTRLTEKQHDDLSKVEYAAQALLRLINDILDFSKIEAGKLALEHVELDVHEILSDVSDITKIKVNSVAMFFSVSPNIPHFLMGDPFRLRQILLNLTNNALKFTETGKVVISIDVVKKDLKHITLIFSVSDTGIGLTSEHLSTLFQEFTQAEHATTRKYGGTGLGLAISKRLVEMMGGKISVKSEYGKGSVFSFTAQFSLLSQKMIAQLSKCQEQHKISIQSPKTVFTIPNLQGYRLLLVEDDMINQQLAKEILGNTGIIVEIASDGASAIQKLDTGFDGVIMDLQMPDMDGYETTAIIRKTFDQKTLPIIAMTANVMKGVREKCLAAGMNDYVSKPIQIKELFQCLSQWFPPKIDTVPKKMNQDIVLNLPGIDSSQALRRLNGNVALFKTLLIDFKEHYSTFIEKIQAALARNDMNTAKDLSHNLKGVAGNLSAIALFNAVKSFEKALKNGQDEHIQTGLKTLESALLSILDTAQMIENTQISISSPPIEHHLPTLSLVLSLMKELDTALIQNNMNAYKIFKTLKTQLPQPQLEDEALKHLEQNIFSLDFKTADKILHTIANTFDMTL